MQVQIVKVLNTLNTSNAVTAVKIVWCIVVNGVCTNHEYTLTTDELSSYLGSPETQKDMVTAIAVREAQSVYDTMKEDPEFTREEDTLDKAIDITSFITMSAILVLVSGIVYVVAHDVAPVITFFLN